MHSKLKLRGKHISSSLWKNRNYCGIVKPENKTLRESIRETKARTTNDSNQVRTAKQNLNINKAITRTQL